MLKAHKRRQQGSDKRERTAYGSIAGSKHELPYEAQVLPEAHELIP